MICKKCDLPYCPSEFHTEGFDPEKCFDCQTAASTEQDIDPEVALDGLFEDDMYDLGGEA